MVAAAAVAVTAAPASAATSSAMTGTGRLATSAVAAKPNVLGASVSFSITNAKCFSNAITFTARTSESGISGVQQFKQTAREQEFTTSGWVNITGTAVTKSAKFPNDSRNFFYSFNWRATHAANGASYRVIWQGFYLNGGGSAIFKTKQIAVNCL
jgi:hypothetical protein